MTANCAYDALDRLKKLKDGTSHALATYTYDSARPGHRVALGNGSTVTPSYDLLNRLSSLTNALSSVNRNYGYGYDNASRITSITEPRGTVSISGYDDRNEVEGSQSRAVLPLPIRGSRSMRRPTGQPGHWEQPRPATRPTTSTNTQRWAAPRRPGTAMADCPRSRAIPTRMMPWAG